MAIADKKLAIEDKKWTEMLDKAFAFHQEMYEQLPDWTILQSDESEYLRKYILISIRGTSNNEEGLDLNDAQKKEIDRMFETVKTNAITPTKHICFGIIYVVIFRCKSKMKNDEENMLHIPIFRTRQYTGKNTFNTLYIDTNCRVYSSWNDFLYNNKLPPCTMVYPHNGYYQPNPDREITEHYSEVWVSYQDSPATRKVITKTGDITSSVLGVAGSAVTIAAAFTPVAPVVLSAGIAGGIVSGIWSFCRNSESLYDRYKHRESIGLKDATGRQHWLGIAGSAVSVAVSGGNTLITKAAAKGKDIGQLGRAAYNTAVAGEIIVYGAGIGVQIYNLREQYKEKNSVEYVSVALLVTNVFFFGNAVLKVQTAADIINATQGKILDSYRQSLSSKRFRKSFKRMKQKCFKRASNDADAQNEIVRRIEKVTSVNDLLRNAPTSSVPRSSPVFTVSFNNCVLRVNGFELLNIVLFVKNYVKPVVLICARQLIERNNLQNQTIGEQEETYAQLKQIFLKLFSEVSSRNGGSYRAHCTNPTIVNTFNRILKDMRNLNVSVDILPKLFNMARSLVDACSRGSVDTLIRDAIEVLWHYLITCVEDYITRACVKLCDDNLREILLKMINALLAGSNIIVHNLIRAFQDYIRLQTRGEL